MNKVSVEKGTYSYIYSTIEHAITLTDGCIDQSLSLSISIEYSECVFYEKAGSALIGRFTLPNWPNGASTRFEAAFVFVAESTVLFDQITSALAIEKITNGPGFTKSTV